MAGNVNENFEDSHFRRKNAVVSTEIVTNRLKRSQGKNIVDRLMIFHRKFVPKQFDDDLKEYFKWEHWQPLTLSLFSEKDMRKGSKSTFYSAFTHLWSNKPVRKRKKEVVDGGYILLKVFWEYCEKYFPTIFKKSDRKQWIKHY